MSKLTSAISSSTSSHDENYRNFKKLRRIYEKQESRILRFEEKATCLSMAYVIFGAILYNSIVKSSSSSGKLGLNRWIPISLLLSVSFAFWVQLLRTISRYLGISHQSDVSWMEQKRMYHRLFIMDENGQRSISHDRSSDLVPAGVSTSSSHHQRYAYIFTVLSALFIFTMAVLLACLSILSSSDAQMQNYGPYNE